MSRIIRIKGVDYPYNSHCNIIKINTPSPIGKLAELAIVSYLVYLTRVSKVEQICFILAQHAAKAYPIPKNLRDVTELPAHIQKKWLKFYHEKLKDGNVHEVVDSSKG